MDTLADARRIDIISDTHGYLSDELLAALEGAAHQKRDARHGAHDERPRKLNAKHTTQARCALKTPRHLCDVVTLALADGAVVYMTYRTLVVLGLNLKVRLRMVANRADVRRLRTHNDMTAVAAALYRVRGGWPWRGIRSCRHVRDDQR